MSSFYRMKLKLQRFAVPNLPLIATIVFAVGYLLMLFEPGRAFFISYLSFAPAELLRGQIWRLLTGLLYSPFSGFSLLSALIGLYVYYNFSSIVEQAMGTFEFNLFFFSSYLIGYIAMIVLYLITGLDLPYIPIYAQFSVFMAFAIMYPNIRVLLFFFIPIKSGYLALAELAIYIYQLIRGNIYSRTLIVAAFVHIAVYYLLVNRGRTDTQSLFSYLKNRKRRREWEKNYRGEG